MEGVFGLTAVFGRVSQRTDDIEKFDNAAANEPRGAVFQFTLPGAGAGRSS